MKNLGEIVSLVMDEGRKVFVSKEIYNIEVSQMKAILFGAVGMILIAFMSALIVFVIRK